MKILSNASEGGIDLSPLKIEFPDLDFVAVSGPAEVARELGDAEVLVISNRVYTAEMVRAVNSNATALRWIHFTTSGVDKAMKHGGFPVGVKVTHSPGLRAATVSEHAFALLLCLGRRLRTLEAARTRRDWVRDEVTPAMISLHGQTLLIIGMGAVGQAAARKARAFDMNVLAVSQGYVADALVSEVYPRGRAKEALARADAVLLSVPSSPETRGFLDADKLAVMKKTAFVINVSRGDVISEDDLIAACRSGAIAGAGLDVTAVEPTPPESPLWELDNVLLTPHVAGAGSRSDDLVRRLIAENLRLWLDGKPLKHRVDQTGNGLCPASAER